MPNGDDKNKINRLEEIKKALYSSNPLALKKRREGRLREVFYGIPRDWAKEAFKAPESKIKLPPSFLKKFFIFSLAFFFLALSFVFFKFYRGANTISTENIEINVLGNSFTAGGEDLLLQVQVTNKNNLPLELSDLIIEYPKGSAGDTTGDFVRSRKSLGEIKAGQTVNENAKVVLFGEQGASKDIKVSLEYRVASSNAIFVKETHHSVNISSAPITLSVDGPTSVTSGQEITLVIKVTPNTTKVAQGIVLHVEYPPGFQFTDASPKAMSGSDVWDLGDLSAGMEKTVSIRGIIFGEDKEEKSLRFYVGEKDKHDATSIAVVYNSYLQTLAITRPFVEAHLLVNGLDQNEFSASAGRPVRGQIKWVNNLPTKVSNVVIKARITGSALDRKTIITPTGFYDSSSDTITWDKNTQPNFAAIEPGDQGSVDFTFAATPLFGENSSLISSPTVTLEISIRAEQPAEGNLLSEIKNFETKTVKINSDLQIISKALHFEGPLPNSGPIPPKAENKTTYTVVWTVTNSANTVSGAVARATLPFYVNWTGVTSPPAEDISFDQGTKEVVWKLGTISQGAGLVGNPREVAFQVELNPSVSQVGSVPQLTTETTLTGTDNFTGSTLKSTRGALNTRLPNDSQFKTGDETVVE